MPIIPATEIRTVFDTTVKERVSECVEWLETIINKRLNDPVYHHKTQVGVQVENGTEGMPTNAWEIKDEVFDAISDRLTLAGYKDVDTGIVDNNDDIPVWCIYFSLPSRGETKVYKKTTREEQVYEGVEWLNSVINHRLKDPNLITTPHVTVMVSNKDEGMPESAWENRKDIMASISEHLKTQGYGVISTRFGNGIRHEPLWIITFTLPKTPKSRWTATFAPMTNDEKVCDFTEETADLTGKFHVGDGGVLPKQAHREDVGYDLYIVESTGKCYGPTEIFDTKISTQPPNGYHWEIFPRSSISKTGYMLANSIGLIDPNYRGTLQLALTKIWPEAPPLELPCKIGQLVLRRTYHLDTVMAVARQEDLSTTARGGGGFGSTDYVEIDDTPDYVQPYLASLPEFA